MVEDVVKKHQLETDKLTERQLVQAIQEAIKCGDFVKLVRPDGAQCMIYEPYRAEHQLNARIAELLTKVQDLEGIIQNLNKTVQNKAR